MSFEKKPWVEGPINIYGTDKYFFNKKELDEYCYEKGCNASDLELVLCEPELAKCINPYEFYNLEDAGLPHEIVMAFEELNNRITKCKEPISWFPSNIAAELEQHVNI
jgi:hypothetical protein